MRTRSFLTLVVPLLLCTITFAQESPVRKHDPEVLHMATKSAEQALASFGSIVNQQNYKSLGFDQPGDVQQATLGVPIRGFMIRLDELKTYAPGRDPLSLLRDLEKMTFPVMVSNRTRSSVTVARAGGTWTTTGFGAANYIQTVDSLRSEIASRDGQSPADYLEVNVPALNVFFLGVVRGGRLYLTPLLSHPAMGLVRGTTLPAEDALIRLVPAARDHSGLPS